MSKAPKHTPEDLVSIRANCVEGIFVQVRSDVMRSIVDTLQAASAEEASAPSDPRVLLDEAIARLEETNSLLATLLHEYDMPIEKRTYGTDAIEAEAYDNRVFLHRLALLGYGKA